MKITDAEIDRIAQLAKLEFNHQEKVRIRRDLNLILEYVEKLNDPDTTDVEPLSHPLELTNVMRDDRAERSLSAEEALKNAPARKDNFFTVPKVIR